MELHTIPGKQIESEITLLGEGSLVRGDFHYNRFTRIHGRVEGKVIGENGSYLVIGESASVHGEIRGDEIVIDGFVYGDVHARTKLTISESGKLLGNAFTPKFEVKFGAHFEGKAMTSPGAGGALKKSSRSRDTSEPSASGHP